MDPLVLLLVMLVLFAAVALVSAPLRRGRAERAGAAEQARREELEAQRDAKYREIRDLELDFRMGKLGEQDFRALDRTLRGEAVELLRELDRLQ